MLRKIVLGLGLIMVLFWVVNTSLFTSPPEDAPTRILAHRGIHQTYDRTGLGMSDCTAIRIDEPRHGLLENTLPSIEAALDAGAAVVEIDIHWTKDGHFTVFHDWTLECRTDGTGNTEDATRAELKALDIGYGYTADGGQTFPFRGRFVGAMPMLDEVFAAFPDAQFLINLKSNNSEEGKAFADLVRANSDWADAVYGYYGGPRAVAGDASALPDHVGFSPQSTKACLKDYALFGWTGSVPETCRNTQLLVPINYAPFLWGWPHKFARRMDAAGTDVLLGGPYTGRRAGSGGINTAEDAAKVPAGFDGFVWTDKAEHMAQWLENWD